MGVNLFRKGPHIGFESLSGWHFAPQLVEEIEDEADLAHRGSLP